MSNDYFVASGEPATGAFAASAPMRSEFSSIEDAFDKLPTLSSGTAGRAVVVNSLGTLLTTTTGTLALAGNFATTGAFNTTLVVGATVSLTLPLVDGTLATLAGTETLSNKTLVAPALGTPVSGVATNLTGTAAGLTAGNVTTNANLTGPIASVGNLTSISAQTGAGTTFVVQTSPTLITPVLGVATATSINKIAITAPASGATLTIADGKTLTANASLTLAGTDSTTMTFPSTTATIARTDAAQTFTGVQTFSTPIATGSVATMTATVGGGVPTPPNNTTDFLRGDGTFAPAGGSAYTQVGSTSASGSAVVFSSLSSEDFIIYISGASIAAGTAQLSIDISTDNGSTYVTAAVSIGTATALDTTAKYATVYITGAKTGTGAILYSSAVNSLSANAAPRVTSGAPTVGLFYLPASVNAIRVNTSASTFNAGTIVLKGRG